MKKLLYAAVTLFVLATGINANAATLNAAGGILYGASGVDVGGTLYDVEFLDGTCIALFDGCDDVTDFTFQTGAAANLASQALLDQVFINSSLGDFDASPEKTNGISNTHLGTIFTVYSYTAPNIIDMIITSNYKGTNSDSYRTFLSYLNHYDQTNLAIQTFARWTVTAVPLPAAFPLYGAGLAVMGFIGWRRKRKA
ncbi:hypothetical protein A9Q83_10030 [Alphaproteobacteria bacterium 46_93_T64]|nr:hypothetical protein A9Q83_10030 [Alphaproteobacteria bacterium 46_93_T64]